MDIYYETVKWVLATLVLLTGCDLKPEASCQQTTSEFFDRFNDQDFRGITSLFHPRTLNEPQINRLVNNLTYLYNAAGTIQQIRFANQDGNSISYVSIHEHTAMDVVFKVDNQCKLVSYLIDTHFPDSLPELERNKSSLILPFEGEWYVEWGGTELAQNYHNAHRNLKGAIDFTIKDQTGKAYRTDGKTNEDFYSYGKPVIAPSNARVVKIVSGVKDNPVGKSSAAHTYGNAIVLQTECKEYLLLAHLQNQSIIVQEGQKVSQGAPLARCGNSGYSSAPHLHFIVQNVADLFHPTGAASYFDNIEVNGVLKQDYSPVQGERVRNLKPFNP